MSRIDDMIRQMCPDGVNHEPLSALGVWKGGGTPSRTRTDYWTRREIPWVTPKDMGDIELKGAEDWISSEATIDSTTPLIAGPSLAVVARSSILKQTLPVSIVPFDSTFNQDMKVLRPRKDIDVRFILHLLRSRSSDILRTSSKHGGSVDSLVMNRFFSYAIPIPPTAIQVELVRTFGETLSYSTGTRNGTESGTGGAPTAIRLLSESFDLEEQRSSSCP